VCGDILNLNEAVFEIFRQAKDPNSALRLPPYRHFSGKVVGANLPRDNDSLKQRHVRHCANVLRRMLRYHMAVAFDSFVQRVVEVREKRARCKSIIYMMAGCRSGIGRCLRSRSEQLSPPPSGGHILRRACCLWDDAMRCHEDGRVHVPAPDCLEKT
jgi:hypothetical protein